MLIHNRYFLDRQSLQQLGQWHNGIDVITHQLITVKICSQADEADFEKEVVVYQRLAGIAGIPMVCWAGSEENMCVLILAGASVSLLDLQSFYPKTISFLKGEVEKILKSLHEQGLAWEIRVDQYQRPMVVLRTKYSEGNRFELKKVLCHNDQLRATDTFDLLVSRYLSLYRRTSKSSIVSDLPYEDLPEDLHESMKLQNQRLEVEHRTWQIFVKGTLHTASLYQRSPADEYDFFRLTERSLDILIDYDQLSCIEFVNEMFSIAKSIHETQRNFWSSRLLGHLCSMMARLTFDRSLIEQQAWLKHAWTYCSDRAYFKCASAASIEMLSCINKATTRDCLRLTRCSIESATTKSPPVQLLLSLKRIIKNCDRRRATKFLRLLKLNLVENDKVLREVASRIPIVLLMIKPQACFGEDAQAYLDCASYTVKSLPENECTGAYLHSVHTLQRDSSKL